MKRLALLGYMHETNTFASAPTTYEDFAANGIMRGAELVRRHAGAHSTFAGFLELADQAPCEVVPLYYAATNPSGTITAAAFERLAREMLTELEANGPWDGVLLAIHGAAVSEQYPDADGEIAARVRAVVGPRVPIGMALDLHTNLTPKMVDSVTATVLYRTNPHLDPRERALECGLIIWQTITGDIQPVQALETPPVIANILCHYTGEEPMRSLYEAAEAATSLPGVLSASIAQGYPYADVVEMGMAFLAVTDNDPALARKTARALAARAWERRASLNASAPSAEQAIRDASRAARGPIVLMDVGDNIGAGTAGDSTILLDEAVRQGVGHFLQTLYDPEAVQQCIAAGVGAKITLAVGGKSADAPHGPVTLTGRVRTLADGDFEERQPIHGGGRYFSNGKTAVLQTDLDQTVVLTSKVLGNTSIQQIRSLGIFPEHKQVIVAKGVVSPRPAYQPIAAAVVLVDTPGISAANLFRFNYQHRRRPLYPFETEAQYSE